MLSQTDSEDFEEVVESDPSSRFVRFKDIIQSDPFKQVYRALDTERGTEVAWHRIPLVSFHHSKEQIQTKFKLFQEIQHPNIIEINYSWMDNAQLVFITEISPSGSLLNYSIKSPQLRLQVIKRWCRHILEALEYLHTKDTPIIHRFIQNNNLFITFAVGEVKLGDFVLPTLFTDKILNFGNVNFMAPEYFTERHSTGVDIWAFGMSILEMVTRVKPYYECGDNVAQIVKKISNYILPMQLDAILDPEMQQFIKICLNKQDERPTATELLRHPFLEIRPDTDNCTVRIDEDVITNILNITPTNVEISETGIENATNSPSVQDDGNVEVTVTNSVQMDENSIQLELRIDTFRERHDVEFQYNKILDSPEAVVEELCAVMDFVIPARDDICELISQQIEVLEPGVSQEEGQIPDLLDFETSIDLTASNSCCNLPILRLSRNNMYFSDNDVSYLENSGPLLDSPIFTPPIGFASSVSDLESLLDSSDEVSRDSISVSSIYDEVYEIGENGDDELEMVRQKHEEAKLQLLAQQKKELDELIERKKERQGKRKSWRTKMLS